MNRAYKVRVIVTKTMWVTQDDIEADAQNGWLPMGSRQLDEELAINYCNGTLIEELRNNPNRGSAEIISIYDFEKRELKTKRKYLSK